MVAMCVATPHTESLCRDASLLTCPRQILEKLASYERLLKWSGKPTPQEVIPGKIWQVPSDVDTLPPDTGVSNGDCSPSPSSFQ